MSRIRRSILLAVVASVFGSLSGVAAARDLVDGWKGGHWNRDPLPGQETWAAYYSKHAQVRNGSQKQLANGVRWRLATDRRTEIAIPRIVWMPDSRSPDVANRMLEMVHGGAMLFSGQQQEGFLAYLRIHEQEGPPRFSGISEEDYRRHFWNVRQLMPKRVVTQSDVALTYASTRYASLIDLGFKRPHATCNPVFRFADLLEICDQASLERFEALVQPIEDGMKVAARSRDPSFRGCRARSIDDEQEYVVYLTVGGLAVHLTEFWSNAESRSCPLELSPENPLIVPYLKLEPLMKPGPLREELLRLK
jgi:hypothetical protein